MSAVALILAAAISAVGLVVHMTRGRRLIVAPMLATDLHPVPRQTLEFSWQWGGVTMAVMTLSFLAPLFRADLAPLAAMAVLYALALGLLSFRAMRRGGFRVAQMPQWIVFWAAALAGLAGLGGG